MVLVVFEAMIMGADASGRFVLSYRVLAANKAQAEVLARASAVVNDIAVLDIGVSPQIGRAPQPPFDLPRVLSIGERTDLDYLESAE